jgi:hypothetical protein
MKKLLLLLLLIPGLVLAKENLAIPGKQPEKICTPAPKPKSWSQMWQTRMDACTTPKEKEYLTAHKTVPLEYTLDPTKTALALAIYEEHRKIYFRIKPCLDKQSGK